MSFICEHKLDPTNIEQFVDAAWVVFILGGHLLEEIAKAIAEIEQYGRTSIMCDLNLIKTGFIASFKHGPAISGSVCHLVQANIEWCCSRKS